MGSANCFYPFGLRNMKCPVGQISNKSEKSDKQKLKDLNKFERFDFPFGRRAKPSPTTVGLKKIDDSPIGDDINKRSLRLRLEDLNARKSSSKLGSPLAKAIFNLLRQTDIILGPAA